MLLQGIAKRALQVFMAHAHSRLGVKLFRAKILESNLPSIGLFGSLGYVETKRVAVFKEVYMDYTVEGEREERLKAAALGLRYRKYDAVTE